MTRAVIAGSDAASLGPALTTEGVDVTTAAGTANRDALEAAGIDEADVLVVTETTLATALPVAKELNPPAGRPHPRSEATGPRLRRRGGRRRLTN